MMITVWLILLFHCYMQIHAAYHALRDTKGLPWPKDHEKNADADLLEWLQAMFGFQVITMRRLFTFFFHTNHSHVYHLFVSSDTCSLTSTITLQKDNVSNQREQLILLIASM